MNICWSRVQWVQSRHHLRARSPLPLPPASTPPPPTSLSSTPPPRPTRAFQAGTSAATPATYYVVPSKCAVMQPHSTAAALHNLPGPSRWRRRHKERTVIRCFLLCHQKRISIQFVSVWELVTAAYWLCGPKAALRTCVQPCALMTALLVRSSRLSYPTNFSHFLLSMAGKRKGKKKNLIWCGRGSLRDW